MRIVLNGGFWDLKWSGIGIYTRELWQAFHQMDLPPAVSLAMVHPYWQTRDDDPAALLGQQYWGGRPLQRPRRDHLRLLYWEQVSLPHMVRRLHADLLHTPGNTVPYINPCPVVVTLHDVIPLVLSEYKGANSSRGFRLRWMFSIAAAKRAPLLITDSEYSKRDIVRVLGVPEQRIIVIYLAVDEHYRPHTAAEQAETRARLHLPEQYIFYIGGFERRKNVPSLLQAYTEVLKQMPAAPPLVIAGRVPSAAESAIDPALFPDVHAEIARLGIGERVRFLGKVTDEDKRALYGAATLFVYPGTYEGFGLDPLEGLASGTPVISSNRSSMPEVVGDAAVQVDPTDIAALSQAMIGVLTDPSKQAALRAAGPHQAARFSWRKTAEQTFAAYMGLMQRRK